MHPAVSRQLFQQDVAGWPADLAEVRGWHLHSTTFPTLECTFTAPGRTPIRLRLDYSDWNDQPPSILLLDSSGQQLTTLPANPTGVFNSGPHPKLGRPFICMVGSREYHTHDSHLTDHWEQHRNKVVATPGGLLTQLWHAWLKGSG